jgi:pyruvate/2-oxoglutarate dehydrogenase complex dihydrolipoamide dehydrogenase (E3) component
MANQDHYENLILGSGEGGKFLAWHLARNGQRTAVIERKLIGGSCPNTNCLPSKNEIWSAKVAHLVRHAEQFGMVTGPVATDMKRVLSRKREMVQGLIDMHLDNYKATGAGLIMGFGKFTAPKTIEVALNDGGTRTLTSDRVFLNLGTHATIPDVPGLVDSQPMTNVETLELDRLPKHLIVLGGGYVGLELAQAYRRFGSTVTVLEAGPRLLVREDPEVSAAVAEMLGDEGVTIHSRAELVSVAGRSGDGVRLTFRVPSGEHVVEGSDLLVAVGRTPNTTGIGLEEIGVKIDARGFIVVNDRLETTAPDTWAIGECAGSPQFTHVSFDDFRVIRDNLAGKKRSTANRMVPYCMYTEPPLARVGLSEGDAQRQGEAVRIATLPVVRVLRSRTISETRGFMKAVVEAAGDRILGFTMLGPEAGEVMAVVQTAITAGLPYTALRDAILAHPTMAEGLGALFSSLPER